ncbi:MAG: FadR/GntR family transcriptional regulator [Syntrophobacteraceae bacterium]
MKEHNVQGNLFFAVTPRKVSEGIYQQLVSLIASGRLKPGARLPSERTMALDLGVSRQSIREAIHRAVAQGLIEVRQGDGTFVISSVRESLKPALSIILEKQAERIFDFLEIRKVIEAWCAEKAALSAKASDIRKMRGLLKKMEGLEPGEAKWEKADLEFHSSIAAASHNLVAVHIMEGLKDSFNQYFRTKKFAIEVESKEMLTEQHRAIFEAIQNKDSNEARAKIHEHLEFVCGAIRREYLKSRQTGVAGQSRAPGDMD